MRTALALLLVVTAACGSSGSDASPAGGAPAVAPTASPATGASAQPSAKPSPSGDRYEEDYGY